MEDFGSKAVGIAMLLIIVRVGSFVFTVIREHFNPTENDLEKKLRDQK